MRKSESKEKANNTLICRSFTSRWDILLNQGRICGWWWRARGLFPGTKPKVDFTSFSEVRVNWAYQRRGAERKQRDECQLCSSFGSRNGAYGSWRSRCPFPGRGEKGAAKEVPWCNGEDPGSSDPSSNLVRPFWLIRNNVPVSKWWHGGPAMLLISRESRQLSGGEFQTWMGRTAFYSSSLLFRIFICPVSVYYDFIQSFSLLSLRWTCKAAVQSRFEPSLMESCALVPSSDRKRSEGSIFRRLRRPRSLTQGRPARLLCGRRGDEPLGVRSGGLGSLRSAETLLHWDDFSRRERMETLVSSTAREKNTDEARDGPE